MTVSDIRDIIVAIDPMARHYVSNRETDAFTVWQEIRLLDIHADDMYDEGWRFEVDYFTKAEFDPVAEAFHKAFAEHPGITYRYQVVYEQDTGYIRHIFECEGY